MRARWVGVMVFVVLWLMGTHGKPSDAGDEPYYLLAARSLLVDQDLDLRNNFERNEGALIGADDLQPATHVQPAARGTIRSVHDVGLSVLVAPPLALGTKIGNSIPASLLARMKLSPGRFAYVVVSLFMVGLTACAAALFFAVSRRYTSNLGALAVTGALFFSPPVMAHSFLVFPEVPMLAIVCIVLNFFGWRDANRPQWVLPVCSLFLGLSPWLHRKFSFFAIGLLAVILRESLRDRRWTGLAWLAVSAFVVPQIAFYWLTWLWWGNLLGPQVASLPFSVAGLPVGATGMLIDRTRGLLAYAPIYVLLPCIWWTVGRAFRSWLVPVALLFLPLAAFVTWDAGYSPAARFLVPLMPLLVLPAAVAISRPWFVRVAVAPVLLQAVLSGYAWSHPRALWPSTSGENRLLAAMPGGRFLVAFFPRLFNGSYQ